MQLKNSTLLKSVFALKGNFTEGVSPRTKIISGIEIAPFKNNADAAVSISSDFEMSWAWRECGHEANQARAAGERDNVPLILQLLHEYSIPITWATVGHLFLDSCTRSASGLAHGSMPRPQVHAGWTGDWYRHDPCSNIQEDPLWYAPDLIQRIKECRTPQEIGTHSFSHINFSSRCSTGELVKREMEACADAMRPFGLRATSLVFPRNIAEYSYLPLLAEAGITAVRHRDKTIRLSYPERTPSGVYRFYESMNLRTAKYYDYLDKAKLFIDKAIQRRATYSLWFHPSDEIDVFNSQFRRILQYIDSRRRGGRLWVATMRELASYCEARESVHLSRRVDGNQLVVSMHSSLDHSKYGKPELTLLVPAASEPKLARAIMPNGDDLRLKTQLASPSAPGRLLINVPADARAIHCLF
jgi:hypothetical protein